MNLQLNGKTALVTGSTAGIGLAIAERLAGEGVSTIICGRSRDKLDAAAERIGKIGYVRAVLADPGTAEGAAALIAEGRFHYARWGDHAGCLACYRSG